MRSLIILFIKDLRLISRDRLALVLLVAAPVIVITVAGLSLATLYRSSEHLFPVADLDGGEYAVRLLEAFEASEELEVVLVSAEEARACIPELPRWFDEPFADSSQIPTLLISRFARQRVTVVLSGDGGDEVVGGYNRYVFVARHWPLLRRLPAPARRLGAALIAALPPRLWDRALGGFVRQAGEKAHKLAAVLPADGLDEVYHRSRHVFNESR